MDREKVLDKVAPLKRGKWISGPLRMLEGEVGAVTYGRVVDAIQKLGDQAVDEAALAGAALSISATEWQEAQDEVAKVTKREKLRVEAARVLNDNGCFEMHEEDCPEDDTCSCPLMPLVHAVLNDNDNVDVVAAEVAIAAWDDVKDVE